MGLRRRSRPRRRIRRVVVLGGLVSLIGAYRNWALARSEKRFPELVAPPDGSSTTS